MTGYHFDELGHLIRVDEVDPDQLPPNCTLKPPPKVPNGYVPVFYDGAWDMESIALAEMARADYGK